MLPDLNRLKLFYYVYRARSVVGAAAELNISQPAVSQQLQKLEAELKTSLFTRLHKKLVPTSAGERLFSLVSPMIDGLEVGLPFINPPAERYPRRLAAHWRAARVWQVLSAPFLCRLSSPLPGCLLRFQAQGIVAVDDHVA